MLLNDLVNDLTEDFFLSSVVPDHTETQLLVNKRYTSKQYKTTKRS